MKGGKSTERVRALVDNHGVAIRLPAIEWHSPGAILARLAAGRERYLLRQLEGRQAGLAASVPGFIYTVRRESDGRTHFLFTSHGVEHLFGLSPEDVRDDVNLLRRQYHPDDLPRYLERLEYSQNNLLPFRIELRIFHRDRSMRWVEIRSMPQRAEGGAFDWHGLMIDITERKSVEHELQRKEQEYRTLADNIPDVIARYDTRLRLMYVNRAFESLCGMPSSILLGQHAGRGPLWFERDRRVLVATLEEVLNTTTECEIEVGCYDEPGTEHVYLLRCVPEFDADGYATSVLTVGREITSLKHTEYEMLQSHLRLRQLAIRRDDKHMESSRRMAESVHEGIGQCLAALRMQLSAMNGIDAPWQQRVATMHGLVDDAIARMRDVTLSLRPKAFDLGVKSALEWMCGRFAAQYAVGCDAVVDTSASQMGDTCVRVIYQITEIALDNIARHADARQVHIVLDSVDGRYRLRISDDGKGFNILQRSAARVSELEWAQEQVAGLGGEFVVCSQPGQGTMVEALLPGVGKS